jgi:CubicO group peptidase (beta-lactamase class C family)
MFYNMNVLSLWISAVLCFRFSCAACEPTIPFLPPKYSDTNLPQAFDAVQRKLNDLITSDVLNTTSLSFEVAWSTDTLFSFHHTASGPALSGTENVSGSTVYRVASNTKLFTALSILQQTSAGSIDLDKSVAVYVPELAPSGGIDWSSITIRSLMAHMAGIPDSCECPLPPSLEL